MRPIATAQADLFGVADALPPGFALAPELIDADAERALLDAAAALPLHEARYREYTARRRVHAWGSRYDFDAFTLRAAEIGTLPAPLDALRETLGRWAGIAPADFVHVLVSEYRPGTPLGWHRDAPGYETIVGVSLGSPARLRLRPWPPPAGRRDEVVAVDLAPRSAYAMRGPARWSWQHSVAPVPGLRYSVTMRTVTPPR